ncbi:MAG TPA: uracil-DNA glycosylase, partial [Nitrobacter sp.]|nr:uracil-DNA glycosylase [Nitrobacter sp.]
MTTTLRTETHRSGAAPAGSEPGHDCPLCPRLVDYRLAVRTREPDWFNAPVPSFGGPDAALLIVGLAPGVQGANRTGRPFTGDYAGDLLYATLLKYGFAAGRY